MAMKLEILYFFKIKGCLLTAKAVVEVVDLLEGDGLDDVGLLGRSSSNGARRCESMS